MLKTIKENVSEEIVEKKSKFIADLIYVQSVEEAEGHINRIKKKYFDAKHHCFAYSIMTNEGIVNRASDDGEPSGTAGMPMLNIINKNELINVLVVVTRYFGGILLGTGGLVRAYSDATLKAINNAKLVIEERGYEIEIQVNYNDFEKLNYYCKKNNISIINSEYGEKVISNLELSNEEKEKLFNNIEELSFKIEKYKIIKQKNIRKNLQK
ncbi:MAG: YigZ family protein [Clostridia bacterium]|nr:YigZ family protein [Clostridia bacterium]